MFEGYESRLNGVRAEIEGADTGYVPVVRPRHTDLDRKAFERLALNTLKERGTSIVKRVEDWKGLLSGYRTRPPVNLFGDESYGLIRDSVKKGIIPYKALKRGKNVNVSEHDGSREIVRKVKRKEGVFWDVLNPKTSSTTILTEIFDDRIDPEFDRSCAVLSEISDGATTYDKEDPEAKTVKQAVEEYTRMQPGLDEGDVYRISEAVAVALFPGQMEPQKSKEIFDAVYTGKVSTILDDLEEVNGDLGYEDIEERFDKSGKNRLSGRPVHATVVLPETKFPYAAADVANRLFGHICDQVSPDKGKPHVAVFQRNGDSYRGSLRGYDPDEKTLGLFKKHGGGSRRYSGFRDAEFHRMGAGGITGTEVRASLNNNWKRDGVSIDRTDKF